MISGRLTQDATLCGPPILSCFLFFIFFKSLLVFFMHTCASTQTLILIPSFQRVYYISIPLPYLIFYFVTYLDLESLLFSCL
jgi:hypothetical protein